MKFDKHGYLSTWDDTTYKEYYSKGRKERRTIEKSQFKQLKNKYNGRKNL